MASTRVSSKHQITIPVEALRAAGLREGDRLEVTATGPGRVVVERTRDVLEDLAGSMSGVWGDGALDALRDEWG